MRRVKFGRLICGLVFLCALGSGGRRVAILNAASWVGGSGAVPLRLVAFSLCLALLATSSAQGAAIPEARILSPEDGVTMLTREGALHINVEVKGWVSGRMSVTFGSNVMTDQHDGYCEHDQATEFFTWELWGVSPGVSVNTSVDFYRSGSGERISGSSHRSRVMAWRDASEDPPQLHVLLPVPFGHPDFPTNIPARQAHIQAKAEGELRPNQWHVLILSNQITIRSPHSNVIDTWLDFPPESYRRQCPLIVPIYVMTAILSEEGDIITTSDFHIMWTGDFTDEERAFLPPLGPAQDDGTISLLYPAPPYWTQAKRPCPHPVIKDGSIGRPADECPVRGFMAKEFPDGFQVGDDSELLGYEPPRPGEFRHLWARAPPGMRVTFVVTSCGRMSGLRRTITSFLAANSYPIDRYLVIEDSGDSRVIDRLIEEFGDVFDIVQNAKRMGQLFSIDKAYSMVTTDFIFHCEDDWVFNGIPGFVADSVAILQHEPTVFNVHICNTSFLYPIDDFESFTPGGALYHRILNTHLGSPPREMNLRVYSFSFHPGLRRTRDYRELLMPMQRFFQEDAINMFLFFKGFSMVKLPQPYCNHLDINYVSRHMEYHNPSYQNQDEVARLDTQGAANDLL